MRPSWKEYFMSIAEYSAARSTCNRANVGCVLAKNNHAIATGYNGSIKGHAHCDAAGHLIVGGSCVRALHAEENALASAAKMGISVEGATAYITHFPCWRCYRSLIQSGINRIIYKDFKHNSLNTEEIYQEILVDIGSCDIILEDFNGVPFEKTAQDLGVSMPDSSK